ncbi:DgyrCDS8013 [Dimorphilus gyrociliatus]|uniref:DgyrCDS8013 n=1 Tax=Dimorphilus gyrociliatus TaxID=2664684 RepID=A0A7I8VV57_9ANNE|nr:DgyrCDS8013 [Dimorphilus gyrociliatus]
MVNFPDITLFQLSGAYLGVLGGIFHNWSNRRPMYARAPMVFLASAAGFVIATSAQSMLENRRITKEKYIFDYINTHPEDFPETKPEKYKEVLAPWNPQR